MLSQHELINISKFFICARLVCLECRVFIAGNLEIYTVQYILLLPCQSWVRILQIFLYQNVLSFTSENKTYSGEVSGQATFWVLIARHMKAVKSGLNLSISIEKCT